MATTVPDPTTTGKAPIAFYGWLHDQHGIFLQAAGVVSFQDDATQRWQPVDLPPVAHRGRATTCGGAYHVALRPSGPLLHETRHAMGRL